MEASSKACLATTCLRSAARVPSSSSWSAVFFLSRSSRSSRRIDSDWIPLDASRMSDGASSTSSLSPSDHGCCPSTKSMSLSGSSVTETPRRHRLSRLSSFRLPTPLYMAARSAGSGWTTGGAPSSRLVSSLMFWLPSPGPPLPLTAQDPRFLPTEHVWSLCEPHNRPQTRHLPSLRCDTVQVGPQPTCDCPLTMTHRRCPLACSCLALSCPSSIEPQRRIV
mmetsp:Transcript_58621/g.138057  ORF Transcript_58621/g.138057 Transcript_58621/m.138057 type:complete len:222 (+) Transcript_58621:1089-1754(+)